MRAMNISVRLFAPLLVMLVAGGVLAGRSAAQRSADAEVLLQAAAHAELIEGDLEKAIRLYRDVVAKYPGDRAVAAQALVKLGACYLKIGRTEARQAFERVVRDYPEQTEPVRVARARLNELAGSAPTGRAATAAGPTYRLVLDTFIRVEDVAFFPRLYDFAPDGRRFVFRKVVPEKRTGLLFVADADGTLVRPLLEDTGMWWGFQYPRWAPNDNRIAYLVHKAPPGAQGPWGIFVADVDTGKTTQVGADFEEADTPHDLAWTPDGREITYVLGGEDQPALAPEGVYSRAVATGHTRVIQAMPVHWSLRLGGYSPDGRWLAFHQLAGAPGNQRDLDVWLLPGRGGRALKLTDAEGVDAQPAWALDGRALYFVSDRSGDLNVWKIGVDPATGARTSEPQQVTFFTDGRVMHPRLFAGGRRMALALSRNKTVIKVGNPARPEGARELTRGRAPQLSPDGRTVYYIGEGPEQRGLFSIPAAGGAATRVGSTQPPEGGFDLSPDGRTLAYFAKDGEHTHLYTVAPSGGTARALVERVATADALPISPPRWSPDGSRIAYAQDQMLFTIPATGGQPRKLAQLYQWQEWLWAPDGKAIAALAYAAPGDIAVFVVPADGGEPRRVTPAAEREYKEGLSWHPDGQRLAYMIYTGPGGRESSLREAYVDGRPPTTLVRTIDEWVYVGRWTPDGREFLHLTQLGGRSSLHGVDPATGKRRLFAADVAFGGSGLAQGLLTWSADGRTVAWATTSVTSQLWIAENFR